MSAADLPYESMTPQQRQMERDYHVVEAESDLASAMSHLHQVKLIDGRSEQGRRTAIAFTEVEKAHTIVIAFTEAIDDHGEEE